MKTEKFEVIYSDAYYDGESWTANGCRSERHVIELKESTKDREVMKAAKAAVGLTNVRGVTTNFGNTIMFKPHNSATLLFVEFINE
jgi:hypothetical protein